MPGLLILLGVALALLLIVLTATLVHAMRHPPRRTLAYAVARGLPCDPGEMHLPFEEWWLDRLDGARLPVWEISGRRAREENRTDANVAASNGIVAVFVHGWGHSRVDSLSRVVPFLEFFDRLVLYDQRGHGEADGGRGLSDLGRNEVGDLIALLEYLKGERFVLIGHSMGAVIAMAAAAELSRTNHALAQRLSGIIAYGPYCNFHDSLRGRLRAAGYPGRPITDLALLALRLSGCAPLNLCEADVEQIGCPVLLIHGSEDAVSPIADSRRLAAAGQRVTLYEAAGGAHTDTHHLDPDAHDRTVGEFLQRVAGSVGS